MRILLVEGDEDLGRMVQAGLAQQGHEVDRVQDDVAAEHAVRDGHYDGLLIDTGLPRDESIAMLSRLRAAGPVAPILIITSREELSVRTCGPDSGADDFIVKPFDLNELGARLLAAHRRVVGLAKVLLVHGEISVDPAARQVAMNGQSVALTAREFALLLRMLERRGHVLSRSQLQESFRSWEGEIESNAVEVHIHNLRRKLGKELIRTVHGQGYVIDEPSAEAEGR
jgi:two-component system, OmpR family, response regulator QseB